MKFELVSAIALYLLAVAPVGMWFFSWYYFCLAVRFLLQSRGQHSKIEFVNQMKTIGNCIVFFLYAVMPIAQAVCSYLLENLSMDAFDAHCYDNMSSDCMLCIIADCSSAQDCLSAVSPACNNYAQKYYSFEPKFINVTKAYLIFSLLFTYLNSVLIFFASAIFATAFQTTNQQLMIRGLSKIEINYRTLIFHGFFLFCTQIGSTYQQITFLQTFRYKSDLTDDATTMG